jgi:acylphosphatase
MNHSQTQRVYRGMAVCKSVHYWGRVQGVGFRATVRHIAQQFDVTGYVRNLPDGQVEVVAAGEEAEIERFLAAIASRMAGHIHGHRIDDAAPQTFAGFEIRM